MTDYNLGRAAISEEGGTVHLTQGSRYVKYCVAGPATVFDRELKETVGALDRAYSVFGNTVRVTQIQREKWPIQAVDCPAFENTFFKTARFEGAFRVFETIYYDWFPPKAIMQ